MKTTITPIEHARFDFRVRVEREDGVAAEDLVSGGGVIAEATARRLAETLGQPSRFTLHVALGNDAMQEPEHIATLLADLSEMLAEWSHWPTETATLEGVAGALRDANGNLVGKWHAYV